jgi:hypothetical protein
LWWKAVTDGPVYGAQNYLKITKPGYNKEQYPLFLKIIILEQERSEGL